MNQTFRELLEGASGVSEFIIAVNLDIRGFSPFSKKVESPEAALFIKKVYIKLIDNYFTDASFFKPTGDGLLITIPYTEECLQDVVQRTIGSCFKVLREFGTFCVNDPMINFEVPQRVGIGLSRGTACRLVSQNQTLDYCGRVLNLASRLMDIARPTGIVFDAEFGIELLSDEQIQQFTKDSVYIKGIAEREPTGIWYTKDLTSISPLSKQPIEKTKWQTVGSNLTLRQIRERQPTFEYYLPSEPIDSSAITIRLTYPSIIRGRKRDDIYERFKFDNFQYLLDAGKPKVFVKFDALVKKLEVAGVKDNWLVDIQITYPER